VSGFLTAVRRRSREASELWRDRAVARRWRVAFGEAVSWTERFNAADLSVQRARTVPWIRSCDIGFAISQMLAAVAIANDHPEVAMLQSSVSLSVAIASCVIEPATTTVAFRAERSTREPGPA
jgi:hypothetical protein